MEKLQTIIKDDVNKEALINIGVCAGRHEMPVTEYIFDTIHDPTNVDELEKIAFDWYHDSVRPLIRENYRVDINIYVTGLTVATAAIMRVLFLNHHYCQNDDYQPFLVPYGDVKLWHFNMDNKDYYPQTILRLNR